MKKLLLLLLWSFLSLSLRGSTPALAGEGLFQMTVIHPQVVTGGSGLCVIVRTPEGKTFMFDTANGNDRVQNPEKCDGVANNGRDIIVPWLKKNGIDALDGLVISHAHSDHFGGFIWMAKNFPIRQLWDTGYTLPGTAPKDYRGEPGLYARLRDEYAAAHPGCYHTVHAGDRLDWGKDTTVEVVWPPKEFTGPLENKERMKRDTPIHHLLNANSIGLRITYKNIVFFIVGDIQQDYLKERMIPFLPAEKWKCDVCVLPSHGIHTIQEEVDLTRPQIAIASIANLPWAKGVPDRVRRFYQPIGTKVCATLETGNVAVTTDGEKLNVITERSRADTDANTDPVNTK